MVDNYINSEYCNPFDGIPQDFFVKLEHCGRYLYAFDTISNTDIVADISCAIGYGSCNFMSGLICTDRLRFS